MENNEEKQKLANKNPHICPKQATNGTLRMTVMMDKLPTPLVNRGRDRTVAEVRRGSSETPRSESRNTGNTNTPSEG